jgi:hypothetical protein
MPIWLKKLQPSPWLLRKLLMLAIIVGVGIGSFFYGRRQQATIADTRNIPIGDMNPLDPEWAKRPVAYIYDKPIYRAELGEYLIQRFGTDRLDYMVNRRIVEMECAKHNITVADAEVEARFQLDLKSFAVPITEAEFVNSILRRFGKTLFEWKEDVIRPKIMMEKLVHASVTITNADLKEAFEARYGPKVECRMIVLDKNNASVAQKVWDNARKGREAFLEEARKQFIPNLAVGEGKVPAIHKHFGDRKLEEAAFRLKEGEISGLMEMPDGTYVILLCEKHLLANTEIRFENEAIKLSQETQALRVSQRIPVAFEELRKKANPQLVLSNKGSAVPPPLPLPSQQSPVSAPVHVDVPPPPVKGDVKIPETVPPKVEPPIEPKKVELPPPMPKETPKETPKDKSPTPKDGPPMPPLSLLPTPPISTPPGLVPSSTLPPLVPPTGTPTKKD